MWKIVTYLIMFLFTGVGIYLSTLSVTGLNHIVAMIGLLIVAGTTLFSSIISLVRTMICFNAIELLVLVLIVCGNIYSLVKFFA